MQRRAPRSRQSRCRAANQAAPSPCVTAILPRRIECAQFKCASSKGANPNATVYDPKGDPREMDRVSFERAPYSENDVVGGDLLGQVQVDRRPRARNLGERGRWMHERQLCYVRG